MIGAFYKSVEQEKIGRKKWNKESKKKESKKQKERMRRTVVEV